MPQLQAIPDQQDQQDRLAHLDRLDLLARLDQRARMMRRLGRMVAQAKNSPSLSHAARSSGFMS
jgi:hypothetical protein